MAPAYKGRGMKTVRGSIMVKPGGEPVQDLIFSYESQDRTRGWEIADAWIWISEVRPGYTWSSDFNVNVIANLATDSTGGFTGAAATNSVTDCDDNRLCAWHQKQWLGKATNDFLMPTASPGLDACNFLIDLERIVTTDLYLTAAMMQSSTSGATVEHKLNYMIVLREISISPSQSLIQQLKGIGQDVEN